MISSLYTWVVTTLPAELLSPWVLIGFFGQFVFFLRFMVQWLVSEKKKMVVVPMAFWYLSIVGTLITLAYAVHIKDIVFSTAQVLSLFIYWRNMSLQRRFAALEAQVSAQAPVQTPAQN